jgi:hypothetical protein
MHRADPFWRRHRGTREPRTRWHGSRRRSSRPPAPEASTFAGGPTSAWKVLTDAGRVNLHRSWGAASWHDDLTAASAAARCATRARARHRLRLLAGGEDARLRSSCDPAGEHGRARRSRRKRSAAWIPSGAGLPASTLGIITDGRATDRAGTAAGPRGTSEEEGRIVVTGSVAFDYLMTFPASSPSAIPTGCRAGVVPDAPGARRLRPEHRGPRPPGRPILWHRRTGRRQYRDRLARRRRRSGLHLSRISPPRSPPPIRTRKARGVVLHGAMARPQLSALELDPSASRSSSFRPTILRMAAAGRLQAPVSRSTTPASGSRGFGRGDGRRPAARRS